MLQTIRNSPPGEVSVVDYNSTDGLGEYIESLDAPELVYNRYEGREHYHIAHAYNLAVLASTGDYVAIMGADAVLAPNYVHELRKLIDSGCIWMRGKHYKGILCCQREEFVAAGGYDERFELYGAEDRDLEARLRRRGGKFGLVPDGLVSVIRTSNKDKVKNYRLNLSKREMSRRNHKILDENNANGVLVANESKEWGSWNM
jgi:GT2 family glycosyltransferase